MVFDLSTLDGNLHTISSQNIRIRVFSAINSIEADFDCVLSSAAICHRYINLLLLACLRKMVCQKRIHMIFHMDEVPLLELIFYARRLSQIYVIVFILGIVMLCLTPGGVGSLLFALSIVDVVLIGLDILVLRLVIWNTSRCNCLTALLLSLVALVVYVVLAIAGIVTNESKLVYFTFPFLWILLEITTVIILYGFYRKIVRESEQQESSIGSALITNEILYSHSAA